MSRYEIQVDGAPVRVEADDWRAAKAIASEQHPGASIGHPFLLDAMPEVPKKRSGNSRFHLADVDKMGADGPSPLPGRKIVPKGRRR